jgi:cephalosporin hydroxylase
LTTWDNLSVAEQAINKYGAVQKPLELAELLALLNEPTNILEIGYWNGGTHWAFEQTGAEVLSIDMNRKGDGILTADSHDPETFETVHGTGILYDMLFIDGDHSYPGVLLDYYSYRKLVKPGGFVALHDICPTVFRDRETNKPCNVEKAWEIIRRDAYNTQKKVWELMQKPLTWGGIGIIYQ